MNPVRFQQKTIRDVLGVIVAMGGFYMLYQMIEGAERRESKRFRRQIGLDPKPERRYTDFDEDD